MKLLWTCWANTPTNSYVSIFNNIKVAATMDLDEIHEFIMCFDQDLNVSLNNFLFYYLITLYIENIYYTFTLIINKKL